jgi:uncharacterized sulfatase
VLFIISDDLNTHMGCYGDPMVKTPNLDHLAQRGIRFDRAFCQYPVCNPSRTSFLSGYHPETSHVMIQTEVLRDRFKDVVYMPEHFHANGYFTASVGKVQHGGHHDCKWDVEDDLKAGESDESEAPKNEGKGDAKPRERRRAAGERKNTQNPSYTKFRATATDDDPENADTKIAAKTIELLEKNKDKSFFIAVGFHKPHVPHVAPKKYFDMYPLDKIQTVKVPPHDEDDIPKAALASKRNYQPEMPDQTKREIIASYLACVTYMDAQVGRVLAALDHLKLSDNTIVVFIGDHGWHFGEHNWWAKASLFEESARPPLIVAGPQVKSGQVCPRVVEYLDIYPTLAEVCGLPKPPQGEGKSFAPLLKNPTQPWNKVAFTCENRPGMLGRSVRNERYRYTEWNEGKAGAELYDHDADPHEWTNLATSADHQKTVAEMKANLARGFAQ